MKGSKITWQIRWASRSIPLLAIVLLALILTQMTGCVSVQPIPEGSLTVKQQALSLTPPPGKAGVYVIRIYKFIGHLIPIDTTLDYQEFGSLKTDSYLFGVVPPGEHVLRVPAGLETFDMPFVSKQGVHFTAEAGRNYFFRMTIGGGAGIVQLSEAEGQAYVQKFKLSSDSRFEYQNKTGTLTTEQITREYRKGRNMLDIDAIKTVQQQIENYRISGYPHLNFSYRYGADHEVVSANANGISVGDYLGVVEKKEVVPTSLTSYRVLEYGHYQPIKKETYSYPTVTKVVLEKYLFSTYYYGNMYGRVPHDTNTAAILFYQGDVLLGYCPIGDYNKIDINNLLAAYLALCPNIQ